MATTFWNPNQIATAQVDILTVTVAAAAGTITATMGIAPNTRSITYTMTGSDDTSTSASALQALLAASADPMFAEATWSVSTNVITGIANTPGTPFTLAASSAAGAALTHSTTTANRSPSDVIDTANWSRSGSNSLPQNNDILIIQNSSTPMLWNLDQLSAVTLASLTRWQSMTGQIGLPDMNPNGYIEYRPRYFKFGVNASPINVILGNDDGGSGPPLERYDPGANQVSWIIKGSGSASQPYNIYLLGTNTSNTLQLTGTNVAMGINPGETAAVTGPSIDGGGSLDLGLGVTCGGILTLESATANVNTTVGTINAQNGSTLTLLSTGLTYTTITVTGGSSLTMNSNSTITTLNLTKSSTMDKSPDARTMTITNSNVDGDTCSINDPLSTITFTNATTVNGQVSTGWFRTGPGRTWKVT